jgi:hypothetical protein
VNPRRATRDVDILSIVRTAFVAYLLALMTVLPVVDIVYCPDGCTEAGRTACAWQSAAAAQADGCGLCLNGVAVSSPAPYVAPVQRIHPLPAPRACGLVRAVPRPIDQPPRRS